MNEDLDTHDSNEPHQSHRSLYNCFIQNQESNGIYWTEHGANCGICLQELEDVIKLKKEEKSDDQIIEFINEAYKF